MKLKSVKTLRELENFFKCVAFAFEKRGGVCNLCGVDFEELAKELNKVIEAEKEGVKDEKNKRERIKVVLFDLDGTLTKETCWTEEECLNATPNEEMVKIERKIAKDHFVIIWTARKDDLLSASVKWLRKHDIPFQAISNNKTSCDIAIDDKTYNTKDVKNFLVSLGE